MTRTQLKSIIKTLLKEINEPTSQVDSVDNVSPNTDVPDTTINPKIATLNKKKNDDILLKQKLEASMVPKQKKIDQLTKDLIPIKKKVNDVNSDIQKVNQELDREKIDENVVKSKIHLSDASSELKKIVRNIKDIARKHGYSI